MLVIETLAADPFLEPDLEEHGPSGRRYSIWFLPFHVLRVFRGERSEVSAFSFAALRLCVSQIPEISQSILTQSSPRRKGLNGA
jgi:hypothetical protein